MIDLEKEREDFEKWYENVIGRSLVYKTYDKSYLNSKTQEAWKAWQAAKAHEAEKMKGYVLVPVQCPDPDFADSLFDELSKKAIGEFGDDLLIHFSDIDAKNTDV